MKAWPFIITLLGACALEKMPAITMVRNGKPLRVHRVVLLPSECETTLCKGLDGVVAAELAFRGYEVVDLGRVNALERERTEVRVSYQAGDGETRHDRRVVVRGPTLSDVDIWVLRDELTAMGVDSIVRVRTAEVFGKPARIVALVRVTQAGDATLIASSYCEIEVGSLVSYQNGAELATRCALAKVLR